MTALSQRVNVIPLIAKSDSLTPPELIAFKLQVKHDLLKHQIPVFPFDGEDDEEEKEENDELRVCLRLSPILS